MKLPAINRGKVEVAYATKAVSALSNAWMRSKPNRSGLRSTFRRWRPITVGSPTLEMEQLIWGWLGTPVIIMDEENTDDQSDALGRVIQADIVSHAAVVVAMRAIAGDHPPVFKSLGIALNRSGLSDLRMMQFLTAPSGTRLEAMLRLFKLLDVKGLGIRWNEDEVRRILNYLFGTEDQVRSSTSYWASDFFMSRGKTKGGDASENDSESNDNSEESHLVEPTEQSTKE